MGGRLRAAFAVLFLIGLLSPISYPQAYPRLTYLNYSQISPGFVPYPACEPLAPAYEQCRYPARIALMKPNTGLCDYDYAASLFVVDSFSFSFQLPKTYALEVTMLLDDCKYSTDGVSLALNGRCTATTASSCRNICDSPSSYRTFTFDESCTNEGANAISVRGYVSNPDGISQVRLGSASCPMASCGREFNIYAYMAGKQKEQALVAYGSYSIADAVTYSFSLANTPDAGLAGGQGPLLEARLPADAFKVVIGNTTLSSPCPGPQCNFSSGLLSTPIAGELSLSYSVPKVDLLAGFSDNKFSAYFPGDCANITLASSVSGVPVTPHYTIDGSNFQGCASVQSSVGSHSFAISAYDEPHGHRGEGTLNYLTESFPLPAVTESVIGSFLALTFAIPKSHITYDSPINYQLPADFTGETPGGPCEILNGSLIILPNCPPYSDCSFPVKLKIKNITYSVSNVVPPSSFVFGQPVIGYAEVSAFNTNPVREMPLVIGPAIAGFEVEGGNFETKLLPLEQRKLNVPLLLPTPSECGRTESVSGRLQKVSVCMQFPENFPKIQGAYLLRVRGVPQNTSASFDGAAVPVSVNGEILTATFASLPGIHNLAFSFEAEAFMRPDTNNETVENETANTNAYVPESTSAIQPSEPNAQRNITFLNKPEANFGEPVEILIYENGSPANGLLSVFSPSGKEFQVRVEGGIARFTPYEEGGWVVEFAGISVTLRISGATAGSETGGVPQTKGAAFPELPLISSPVKGDYLVFLLIPLLPIPILAVVIAHFLRTPAISINKRRENGKITLILENGNAWLEEVFINDSAPEGSAVSEFGNASITESITGTRLKWRLPSMKPRQVWTATYRISPESETPSRANLAAFTEKGKEIRISSN